MTENHTATAVLVGAVLFLVVGVVQLVRGLVLVRRSRRPGALDMLDAHPVRDRARGVSAFRASAVCFTAALVASVLVDVSVR
ncbi:hypothetical protein [Sanguibacter sp. 25GB23B1]|uniref:hypothetical protein n=1 Tax=unclassified Sanguibacter TaxID=2645534 RepID=UPI0032AFF36A